jgi:hypothetical protein
MAQVRDLIGRCNTGLVRGLSRQIIAEMELIIPNALVSFADLDIVVAGPAVTAFLQPAAKEALRLAIHDRGRPLRVTSAYRTVAQQYLLRRQWETGQCHIPAAAEPGRSNHEDGLALDIADHAAWRPALQRHGWRWLGPGDKVHFTFVGGGTRDEIGSIGVRAFQRLWNKHNPQDRIGEDGDYGPQTAARLAASPADGFAGPRLLLLEEPLLVGEDVRRLQQALVDAGSALEVNGRFDAAMETAVRAFQERQGLRVDGIIGPSTRKELGLPSFEAAGLVVAEAEDGDEAGETEEQRLIDYNQAIIAAEFVGDAPRLAPLLHEALVFRRAGGGVVGKQEFLDGVTDPDNVNEALRPADNELEVRIFEDQAVTSLRLYFKGMRGGQAVEGVFRNTRLWLRVGDDWQCAVWYNTPA